MFIIKRSLKYFRYGLCNLGSFIFLLFVENFKLVMNYECLFFYGLYFYDDVFDFFFIENLINDGLIFFFSVCVLFWENKVVKLFSKFLIEGKYFNIIVSDV